ncbi:type II toxin-antitoxin system RelE/ParE family toxin [Saccharospirillum salsuginis]|uniref:Addiction module antitoxin RelB n=1 Tax=Saccharospirillum salsuginis TaxID=418750 RepID=A0A918N723_9GAMM|nr:type II toxin-antitoxin system RelE/ParE family toxin [Saccharospirillum salsuginis]GGX42763.1 addiction module antitoxin RelB [Saccharospirillum salsuginis]
MLKVLLTDEVQADIEELRDRKAKAKIRLALDKLELGNLGDVKPVGEGVSEIRLHYGPGYRIYYFQDGEAIYVVACVGDKATQSKDVRRAKEIKRTWKLLH